jgi:PDZ domain-containing secreted protein/Zn-dependent protease
LPVESTVRFFRVRGIPVGAHWSWLFVFALVVWSLSASLFPATYPGLDGSTYLFMGLAAAVLFFGSVVLHELGHTFVALAEGMRIRGISLWLFGGVAHAESPFSSPAAEFRTAVAGPLVSAGLALGFAAVGAGASAADAPEAVVGVADYLARINLLLFVFNLVPALPLDGGRMLHAWLWRRRRSHTAATLVAARAGRAFGVLLAAVGGVGLLAGGGVSGAWLVFLGLFIVQAAQDEATYALVEHALGGVRVRDLMVPVPVTVPTLPTGSLGRGPTVRQDDRLLDVLPDVTDEPGRVAVVLDDAGREVGLLSSDDVLRAVELQRLRPGAVERPARRLTRWLVVTAGVIVAGGLLYHPPYVVIMPGKSFDIRGDVTITGVGTQDPSGPYLLTSVRLGQSNAFGTLWAALRGDREVVAIGDVLPEGVDPASYEKQQEDVFADSRQLAAVAAARAAGLEASVTGTGAEVFGVVDSAPAADVLATGDTIVAVDGHAITTASELPDLIAARPAGTRFTLTVERAGAPVDLRVRSADLPQVSGGTGLGVLVETRDLRAVLPFQVEFRDRPNIGGPSAGLAYALAIADMIDAPDDAGGRAVAATGTIDAEGRVGEVGGVPEKAVAAARAGADVFLVPTHELDEADDTEHHLTVLGADDLSQALSVLRSTG